MKKIFYAFVVIAGVFVGSVLLARAISIFDITYPIAELNNCASQVECKIYCDDLAHKDTCLTFAEKYGFIAKEKIEQAKKIPIIGPGNCRSQKECRAYCDDQAHLSECSAFADKYGIKIREPRGEAVSAGTRLIKEQGGLGGCKSQDECRAYCDNSVNQKECLAFAEKNNLIDQKEIKIIKKVLKSGGPGGCKGEKECRVYCDNIDHFKECGDFAKANGLMNDDEIKMMEQDHMLNKKVMENGGPGGCKSQDECRAYCGSPDHVAECLSFAVEHGGMDKDKARQSLDDFTRISSRKIESHPSVVEGDELTVRPGGCKTEEECAKYCSDPAHQSECDHTGIRYDGNPRIQRAEQSSYDGQPGEDPGSEKESEKYQNIPIDILDKCIKEGGTIEKSASSDIPKCLKEDGEEIIVMPNGMMRNGGEPRMPPPDMMYGNKLEDMKKCGPKPMRPTPQGCEGPVCKNGHWDFVCGDPDNKEIPQPQPGHSLGEQRREGSLCAQEYKPVCGANNRTYPNECFAKKDNVFVAKDGPCGAMLPPAGYPANSYSPTNQYPQQYTQPPAPQSKRITESFFSNLLQAFSRVLILK